MWLLLAAVVFTATVLLHILMLCRTQMLMYLLQLHGQLLENLNNGDWQLKHQKLQHFLLLFRQLHIWFWRLNILLVQLMATRLRQKQARLLPEAQSLLITIGINTTSLLASKYNGEQMYLARAAARKQLAFLSPLVLASPWLDKMTALMAGKITPLYVLFLRAVSPGIPVQHQP